MTKLFQSYYQNNEIIPIILSNNEVILIIFLKYKIIKYLSSWNHHIIK